jgi:phosphohistidine phosphatase
MESIKTLYVVRHGKSSWEQAGVDDIDRPLKERGIRNAYEIAEIVNKSYPKPDCLITSPAARALSTALIFSRMLATKTEQFIIRESLYLANVGDIESLLFEQSNKWNTIMIFGHNPGFTDFVNQYSYLGLENLPTAGLVYMQFKAAGWSDIDKNNLLTCSTEFPNEI